jgi:hypothetical protein
MLFERKRERDKSLFLNNYFLFLFSDWIRVHTPRRQGGRPSESLARARITHRMNIAPLVVYLVLGPLLLLVSEKTRA